jgi:arylsulfatase A-like enzyme
VFRMIWMATMGFAMSTSLAFQTGCSKSVDTAPPAPPEVEVRSPNVLFYVIDGGGADLMSLYGYERPTTPRLEALASQGVLFGQARSASAWTKSSTASFMTSLHHSVLGGFTTNEDHIPDDVVTMAEHFNAAGYRTGVFTTNPFAGSMSGLQAGVDHFRDRGAKNNSASSVELHEEFLTWREAGTGAPWWAHIQTTDVHEPHHPPAPFAGRYASEARRAMFFEWWESLKGVKGVERDTVLARYRAQLEVLGVDPRDFFRAQWDLYDETMAHNDETIGDLVAALKATGEWENTILIVSADHGHPAGSFSRFGRGMIEPQPEDWEGALADSYRTWVPLLVVWPGHLPAGLRVSEPVSLLDVLPTVLELAGLPPTSVQQGRSLVPLMGEPGPLASRPVILEQVQAHKESGLMVGHLEMIDGRWAASMEILPEELETQYRSKESLKTAGGWRAARPHRFSTPRLLLYDLEADPHCLSNVNDAHPEKVKKYTAMLLRHLEENRVLAERFEPAPPVEAGEAQLEALRTLGYVE